MMWRRARPAELEPIVTTDDTPTRRESATLLALWRLTTGDEPTTTILDDYLAQVNTP